MSEKTSEKDGVKTSEFWTTIIGTVSIAAPAVVAALSGFGLPAGILGAASAVLPAIYIWGRSVLKAEKARNTDIVPDSWESTAEKVVDLAEAISDGISTINNSKK